MIIQNITTYYLNHNTRSEITFTTLRDLKRYILDIIKTNEPSLLDDAHDLKANELMALNNVVYVEYPHNRHANLYLFLDRNRRIITINRDNILERSAFNFITPRGRIQNPSEFALIFRHH